MFPIIPYNFNQNPNRLTLSYTDLYSNSSKAPKVSASCDIPRDTLSELIEPKALCGKLENSSNQIEIELNSKKLLTPKCKTINVQWLTALRLSDDCHNYNVRLCMQKSGTKFPDSNLLVLQTVKPIKCGQELLMWFSEDILAKLQMAFLTPVNIQGQKKYVCHICSTTFEYPNPLKLHLTLDCNRKRISSLWDQLATSVSNLNVTTTYPAFNYIDFKPTSKLILNLKSKSKSKCKITTSTTTAIITNETTTTNANFPAKISKTEHLPITMNKIERSSSEPVTIHSSAFKPYLAPKRYTHNTNTMRLTQSINNLTQLTTTTTTPTFAPTEYDKQASISYSHAAQMETLVSNLGKSKQGHLCIYCGKCYSRKYGLKIHIRTHTGYKPLKCKYCLRPFGDPSNLNKHIRLHAEGDTPYKCELCGKVLVRRRDLERHLRSRHMQDIHHQSDKGDPDPDPDPDLDLDLDLDPDINPDHMHSSSEQSE